MLDANYRIFMAPQRNNHLLTGQSGEASAAAFLQEQGYTILQQNYRAGRAEIDIIARKGDLLVFVEVKTRATDRFGFPETAVSAKKEALLLAAAARFIEDTGWEQDIRFDIIAITLGAAPVVHHIPDAFH
jgi:putative endonuclease